MCLAYRIITLTNNYSVIKYVLKAIINDVLVKYSLIQFLSILQNHNILELIIIQF